MIEKKPSHGLDNRSLEIRHPAKTGLTDPTVRQIRATGRAKGWA